MNLGDREARRWNGWDIVRKLLTKESLYGLVEWMTGCTKEKGAMYGKDQRCEPLTGI